ncbi:hypothetical protein BDP27DRAFT_1419512 [Rhodocollybia butyracea]|uniref:PWWP domain-containing protein n=1 Tax=Rhodocollybia butyracea TaxID=206335 RepID=A0A9P5U9I2_9AGAR|nr:hypothetical protein BDP27DRAFT_1419512 [Rhodocollybia butyracea]
MSTMKFAVGDMVLAKQSAFPSWPGLVEDNKEDGTVIVKWLTEGKSQAFHRVSPPLQEGRVEHLTEDLIHRELNANKKITQKHRKQRAKALRTALSLLSSCESSPTTTPTSQSPEADLVKESKSSPEASESIDGDGKDSITPSSALMVAATSKEIAVMTPSFTDQKPETSVENSEKSDREGFQMISFHNTLEQSPLPEASKSIDGDGKDSITPSSALMVAATSKEIDIKTPSFKPETSVQEDLSSLISGVQALGFLEDPKKKEFSLMEVFIKHAALWEDFVKYRKLKGKGANSSTQEGDMFILDIDEKLKDQFPKISSDIRHRFLLRSNAWFTAARKRKAEQGGEEIVYHPGGRKVRSDKKMP